MGKVQKKRIVCCLMAALLAFGSAGCISNGEKENTEEALVWQGKTDNETGDDTPADAEPGIGEETFVNEGEAGVTNDAVMAVEETWAADADSSMGCVTEYSNCYPYNTNEYGDFAENSWMNVSVSPLSTFAADVDTASYAQIRRAILNEDSYLDPSMVRIEEMINYFHYDYPEPEGDDKFAVYTEYMDCPWNEQSKLALIALQTKDIDFSEAPPSNLVFLIDTSGSMFDSDKLPLVQQALGMLAENLTGKDRISVVTYAGYETVVLEGVPGDQYFEITSAIEELQAGGSTNGSAGIQKAYEIAEENFIEGGNNRVILATDGDLNVGVTSEGELERLISEKKDTGVFLSVLGVGDGNYKDNKLETLADKGNGNYTYLDSVFEAKRALVEDMGANLVTVAKDVKLQVEFNPAQIKGYRLIGYENRTMAAEDFNDDKKDGGEMGAGHSVTALYEIVPIDSEMEIPEVDLKYGESENVKGSEKTVASGEMFTVNVRYKEVSGEESKLESYVCTRKDYNAKGSDNLRWAAAVAGFGMYLKDSEYRGNADSVILTLAHSVKDWDEDEYKKEFIGMIEKKLTAGRD